MHFKPLIMSALLCCLWCESGYVVAATQAQFGNFARVRVYQGAEINLYPGSYCYGDENAATIHAMTGKFGIFSMHQRLGMPQTNDMQGGYNEYKLAAGQPVTVSLKWEAEANGIKASCGPIAYTFYPQNAKNYDVAMSQSACNIQIRELVETAQGTAVATPLPISPSFPCLHN